IFARSTAAAEPPSGDIQRWIKELGDDDYQVRKAAADRLVQGGDVARAALVNVANGPDPETRFAARRLVTLIDESTFERQLAEFASDVDGQRGMTLPGWSAFREFVGTDAPSRELFVEMQRAEPELLRRMFDPSSHDHELNWEEQINRLLRARIFTQPGQLSIPAGSSATLLFLGSLPDAKLSDGAAASLRQLTQIPPLSEALAAKRDGNALRRLVCAWVIHCPNRSAIILQQRLDAMFQHSLDECLPLALELLEPKPEYLAVSPQQQMYAILAVGRFGSEENIAALEPLLDDQRECLSRQQINGPANEQASVQIRDVALAVLLRLTGQEPVTYGYVHARPHPQKLFEETSLYLESDERRASALEQWRAWRVQHRSVAPRPESS
ncbi:MAG: hypothetical protein AB7U97_19830, partial [Pirellulales bacterium]